MCFYLSNILLVYIISLIFREMAKSKELSICQRKEIEILRKMKKSEREISKQTGIPKTTVHDTLVRLKDHKTLNSLSRSGRKRKTTAKVDRKIINMVNRSDNPSAVDIAEELRELNLADVSPRTVRNRLHKSGFHGRAKVKKPLLTKKHKALRLSFGQKYQNWTVNDWRRVLWSDETKICLNGSDGRRWTWKRQGEQLKPKHVKQTIKHDRYLMVWGCFGWNGVGQIKVIDGTLTSSQYVRILSNHMLPSGESLIGSNFVFQHDNDPKHTAKNTKQWLNEKDIVVLEWPSQSPDMNPIENLWFELKKKVKAMKLKSLKELPEAIVTCWNSLEKSLCEKLVDSMPDRIDDLLKNKGSWTKY